MKLKISIENYNSQELINKVFNIYDSYISFFVYMIIFQKSF
jgi:lipoprotein signal peptidase